MANAANTSREPQSQHKRAEEKNKTKPKNQSHNHRRSHNHIQKTNRSCSRHIPQPGPTSKELTRKHTQCTKFTTNPQIKSEASIFQNNLRTNRLWDGNNVSDYDDCCFVVLIRLGTKTLGHARKTPLTCQRLINLTQYIR